MMNTDDIKDKLEQVDWSDVLLKIATPAVITFGLGFGLAYMLQKDNGPTIQTYTEAKASEILSTQDLPTQIADLTKSQVSVLENQIANLGISSDENTDAEKEDNLAKGLSQVNADNSFNDFFKAYLSADYTNKASTAYQAIKTYLAETYDSKEEDPKDTGYQIQQNFYNLWNGNSWAKSQKSQTALAGNVTTSILTGTTNSNRYYQVMVPATNMNREFALLNFIVKADDKNKIIAVSYVGQVNNGDINTYYNQLSDLLKNTTTETDVKTALPQQSNDKKGG